MGIEGAKVFEEPENERIESAAIRFRNEVYTGHMHMNILSELKEKFPEEDELFDLCDMGFVTDGGRFVSRKEAREVAERAEQLRGRPNHDKLLHSEDADFGEEVNRYIDDRV